MDTVGTIHYRGSVYVSGCFLVQVYITMVQRKCLLRGVQVVNPRTSL
jgi:hypothetical protein